MKNHFIYLLCLTAFLWTCQSTSTTENTENKPTAVEENTTPKIKLPEALQKGLTAHGGLERWQSMNSLQFAITRNEKKETHLTHLKNRKARISHEDYTIGFDGKEVWVSPNKAAFGKGSARFYHNLRFYFFGLPFLLADPGINYEVLLPVEMNGKTYDAVKVSYNDGVGDAPDDYYIAHFDRETHIMDWILYTVTYYKGEPNENFNALFYEWEKVNGLLLPKVVRGYKYADGELGEQRYETPFFDIEVREEAPDTGLFEMPEEAEIDSLLVVE